MYRNRIVKRIIVFVVILILISTNNIVSGIPTADQPDHKHDATTVEWGDQTGAGAHNHYSNSDFNGGTENAYNEPYEAYRCWDNKKLRTDDDQEFVEGHCFIDEFGLKGNDDDNIPRYFFKGDWSSDQAKKAKPIISQSFKEWGNIASAKNKLITGIAFVEETADESNANIIIEWGGSNECGETTCNVGNDVKVNFNSTANFWSFDNVNKVPKDKRHFYTTAIHEIGHVIGLDDQNDITDDDVMYGSQDNGCKQNTADPGEGPCFTKIDDDSIKGIRDLYSIPKKELSPIEDSVPFYYYVPYYYVNGDRIDLQEDEDISACLSCHSVYNMYTSIVRGSSSKFPGLMILSIFLIIIGALNLKRKN